MSHSAQSPPAVEVRNLSQSFGDRWAVRNASFDVESGSLHGFVGPNGAGKTTTLKVICTLLEPQAGTIRVFGQDIALHSRDVRRRIGFMPDHFSMYRRMSVFEYLDFFGAAYGLSTAHRDKVIHDALALTDMRAREHDLIAGLSRGMQQRVSLARVLVSDPDLLLLDEPASGLDPPRPHRADGDPQRTPRDGEDDLHQFAHSLRARRVVRQRHDHRRRPDQVQRIDARRCSSKARIIPRTGCASGGNGRNWNGGWGN